MKTIDDLLEETGIGPRLIGREHPLGDTPYFIGAMYLIELAVRRAVRDAYLDMAEYLAELENPS